MVYARKKCGGASCYLISRDNVAAFIRTVKPYKGRKYNPSFVWVCVG